MDGSVRLEVSESRDNLPAAATTISPAIQQPTSGAAVSAGTLIIYMRQTEAGAWEVQDAEAKQGGWFRDQKTAFTYIRRTFGRDVRTVVTPSATRF
ncbi:MAG TPA: hypothetical protein VH933_01190 [Aestuariivirgaceae bacterium]|jgi:hypothetical protein